MGNERVCVIRASVCGCEFVQRISGRISRFQQNTSMLYFKTCVLLPFVLRFWYISLVACYRNTTSCTWHYFDATKFRADDASKAADTKGNQPQQPHRANGNGDSDYELYYDIQLVNGNPNQSSSNPLTYHFSFDQQNILEMNLIFLTVYLILVPMQIYAVTIQKHPVTKLFTLSLILEFVSLVFMLIYYVQYTVGGTGNENIKTTGDILDILSRVRIAYALRKQNTQIYSRTKINTKLVLLSYRLVNVHVDFIAASQRVGCDSAANHKVRMDFANVNLDTILCFSRSPVCLESSKCWNVCEIAIFVPDMLKLFRFF